VARHLITSALPYINGVKHLGNLVGSMLPADVYARFLRQTGHDVLFLCATDEHGTPAELAARAEGLPVAEYCRRQHEVQASLARRFDLSFDHFGRSSSPENHELTQHLARRLDEHGFLEERVIRQIWSHTDRRFLPDRYVIGACPYCGYEAARGDQCEACTRVLDPEDLIDPRSAISGSTDLELRESRHLFLLQSRLAPEIREWVDSHEDWPTLITSIARKWLDEGLDDRSITRDLDWGVPVVRAGFEGKVFYVWFDAPIEYIAAGKEWAAAGDGRDWRSWWYDAPDVTYTQFMAKDNVPFHTITFPATLIGSREPWTRAIYIKGFNWLNYYGGKFSTSGGVGVFMDDALELLPADSWRYFLLVNAPESSDSSFTWELVASSVNKDLVGALGNFVNRTLTLTTRSLGPAVPAGGSPGPAEAQLAAELELAATEYRTHLETLQFRKATQSLRAIWGVGNAYLEQKEPWRRIQSDPDDAALTLRTSANLIRLFALLASPIMPSTTRRMLDAVSASTDRPPYPGCDMTTELRRLGAGTPITVPDLLFAKVSTEDIAAWRTRFGGHDIPAATAVEDGAG
jgi:methionyl-tRNA synthetase